MGYLRGAGLAIICMLNLSAANADAAGTPLKVYILAGQSNMQGHAKVSTLGYMADNPATDLLG